MFEALNDAPRIDRERGDRSASLSACIIDSPSVKTNEVRGPRGYDAENMIIGSKLSDHTIRAFELCCAGTAQNGARYRLRSSFR